MRLAGIEDTANLLEKQLTSEISKMPLEEALTLARTFTHSLNLMGIADTHHRSWGFCNHITTKIFTSEVVNMHSVDSKYIHFFVVVAECIKSITLHNLQDLVMIYSTSYCKVELLQTSFTILFANRSSYNSYSITLKMVSICF